MVYNNNNNNNTASQVEGEQPLHLSNSSDVSIDILADLDAPEEQPLWNSGSSQVEIVERMLVDSTKTSSVISAMDEDIVYRMSNSLHDLTFDPVDQHDAHAYSRRNSLFLDTDLDWNSSSHGRASRRASLTSNHSGNNRRGRSPTSPVRSRKRISVKDVDFDPTPSLSDAQQQRQFNQSHDDLSLCSFNTAQTSPQVAADPLNSSSKSLLNPEEQAKYHSALSSLAESMQRTELSRRQVMLQRSLLTPNQKVALEEARHRQLQAIQTEALIPVQTQTSTRELSPTRSSIVNAFFSGSRGTLTNGLEQSRRQLKNYMGQVQNQTL